MPQLLENEEKREAKMKLLLHQDWHCLYDIYVYNYSLLKGKNSKIKASKRFKKKCKHHHA